MASKRLAAIREFTSFGSGFRIAMRDLEIRGPGDILGSQQHGHMESVGYDLYLKLLGEAISEEKGEPVKKTAECLVDVQIEAHIPETTLPTAASASTSTRRSPLSTPRRITWTPWTNSSTASACSCSAPR